MSDRRLLFLLQRAARAAVNYANDATLERLGISVAQLGTLSHLAKHPGSSMTEVADLLDLNKSAVSGMMTRLERARLVKRVANPNDGRAALLFLTPKGDSVRVDAGPVFRRTISEMTKGFTEGELEVVYRFLNKLVEGHADGMAP
jgi:DNA-binding MarR family transcriptional regulator